MHGEQPPREVTKRTLEQRELSRIPGTNGDALRALQNLPGRRASAGPRRAPHRARRRRRRTRRSSSTARSSRSSTTSAGSPGSCPRRCSRRSTSIRATSAPSTAASMGGDRRRRRASDPNEPTRADDVGIHGLAQVDLIDARALVEGPIATTAGASPSAGAARGSTCGSSPCSSATRRGRHHRARLLRLPGDGREGLGQEPPASGSSSSAPTTARDPHQGPSTRSNPQLGGDISSHTGFWRVQARYKKQAQRRHRAARSRAAVGEDAIDFSLGDNFFTLDTYADHGARRALAEARQGRRR